MNKTEIKKLQSLVNRMTQKEAVYTFLSQGHEFTVDEARSAGIADPHRVVNFLREDGVSVYLNPRTSRTGESVKRFRLGTPRKSQVAARRNRKG